MSDTDSCPSCGLKDTDDSRGGHWRVWIGILGDFGGCKSCEWAPENPSAAKISRAYGDQAEQMMNLEQRFSKIYMRLQSAQIDITWARDFLMMGEPSGD